MSRKGVTSGSKSKKIPRIFQRRRSSSTGRATTITDAAAPGRSQTISLPIGTILLQEDAIKRDDNKREKYDTTTGAGGTPSLVGCQVTSTNSVGNALQGEPQASLQVGDAETVANIEKWLKTRTESVSSMDLDVIKSEVEEEGVDRYLGDELPHSFLVKDPDVLSMDIDLSDKKPYLGYDPLLQELQSDKLLEACEKDEFILPAFQLDHLDSLALPPDVMMVAGEVLPSASSQSVTNVSGDTDSSRGNQNLNSADQDPQEECARVGCTEDSGPERNGCIGGTTETRVDNDTTTSRGMMNVYVEAVGPVVIDTNIAEHSDPDDVPVTELILDQRPRLKTKLEPRIIKKRRKPPLRGETKERTGKNVDNRCESNDGIMAMVAISTDKVSNMTQIVINTGKEEQIYQGKTSELIEATGSFPQLPKIETATFWQSSNQFDGDRLVNDEHDLVISNALIELGITDDTLQPVSITESGKVWQCSRGECTRQFNRLYALKGHLLSHFGVRPFKCDFEGCTWAFYSEFKLKRHKETHLKRKDYVCEVEGCGRRFTTIYNLLTHKKLHSRPNKVACHVPGCNEKFQTKRTLELHMRCHDQSHAPYVCRHKGCGKRYYSSNALTSHQRRHSYKEVDVKCSWPGCGKLFDKPCRLKAHMRSHTGSKPYLCTFQGCQWAFSSSSKLKRHEKKHTNERKFICDVASCGKAFLRSEHLKEHRMTHRDGRYFQCNLCETKFSAKSSLYVHIKKNHMQQSIVGVRDPMEDPFENGKQAVTNESQCSNAKPISKVKKMPSLQPINSAEYTTDPPIDSDSLQPAADMNSNEMVKSFETPLNPPETTSQTNESDQQRQCRNTTRMSISGVPTRVSYHCPIETCTKSYATKATLRTHMLRVHGTPIGENHKSFKTVSKSLVPNMDYILYANQTSPVPVTTSQPTDHMVMVAPRDALILGTLPQMETRPPDPEPPPLTSLLKISQPSFRNSAPYQSPETSSKRDQGSARTGLTYNEFLRLKASDTMMNSVVGATDVVLGAAGLVEGLLLPEELPSVYYQDDIVGTECQVLLLDSGSHESTINLRDLE